MVIFESLAAIGRADAGLVGSKAKALARLAASGFEVPPAMCISTAAYDAYLAGTNLRDRVFFELGRKRFEDMRWEEIWDAALRIRNLFLVTPLPVDLRAVVLDAHARVFGDTPVVVRSSAPGEDSHESSFAGLHESFVNVRGPDEVLKHIRLVWASLWSDAALLYRQELGLDVRRSRMAVIVQSMIEGDCSGVAFSREPGGANHALIESVYGLNAGLVDGTIEPDRWKVDRAQGRIMSHAAPERKYLMKSTPAGISRFPLDAARAARAPLVERGVHEVCATALAAERRFGDPQDVEWTKSGASLWVLQSRPITTLPSVGGDDKRPWYRSLVRSFENLKILRHRIEEEIVPGMQQEAEALAGVDLFNLTDSELDAEVARREEVYRRWRAVYWDDCIPFAHGVRLFGQYYNDKLQPRNPYEFMDLLGGTTMLSMARNEALETLAAMVRDDTAVREAIGRGDDSVLPVAFRDALDAFARDHGDVPVADGSGTSGTFLAFLVELADARGIATRAGETDAVHLHRRFLASIPEQERDRAEEMLELARASHRWRDDDNVYLDAVEAQWQRARDEMRRRNRSRGLHGVDVVPGTGEDDLEHLANDMTAELASVPEAPAVPRQLVGQPAGPGLATGPARVILRKEELLEFKRGEVLVCDALDPTMTFVIPLAGAVVERRGGMLIHGAIIAREYGIPCVTGVPDAAQLIRTGMPVTVDGYLGIIRVGSAGEALS